MLGVPFGFEGIFFFLEAIFTGIYLYGWQRLPGWTHFWTGIPIAVTGLGGAVAVMAANSWMNSPGGFTLSHGRVVAVDPWQVFFNRATLYETPHMILAAYMVVGFMVAAVYAAGILQGRRDRYHRLGFGIPFTIAAILTPIQIFVGDTAARAIASQQPVKFAAIEYVTRTGRDVPEYLGGFDVNGKVYFGLRIPYADSLLVGFKPSTQVTGLNSVAPAFRPPALTLIHLSFDAMVGLAFLLLLAGLWALWTWRRRRGLPRQSWFWWLAVLCGPAALVAMECGWIVTEVGRQPWVVYQLMTTAQAATTNGGVIDTLTAVIVVYAVLGVATVIIVRMLARRWRQGAAGRTGGGCPLRAAGRAARAHRPSRPGAGMIAAVAGGILLAGLTLYAALGGADFGGGLWDLLAGGDQRGRAPRQLIDDTITPVWEANHVWLIFVLVIFWTAFPPAFAAVMTAAALPLWLAAFGIVLRGSGFAFRKEVEALHWQRLFGAAFAVSSLIVPFFMGTVIGAIASGRVPANPAHTDLAVWTGPTSLLIGALFVAVCAYLAAVYLTQEASRRGDDRLRRYFARRAAISGAISGSALAGDAAGGPQLEPGPVPRTHPPGAAARHPRGGLRTRRRRPAGHRPLARPARTVGPGRDRRRVRLGRGPVPRAAARHRPDAHHRIGAASGPRHRRGRLRRGHRAGHPVLPLAVLAAATAKSRDS